MFQIAFLQHNKNSILAQRLNEKRRSFSAEGKKTNKELFEFYLRASKREVSFMNMNPSIKSFLLHIYFY